MQRLLIRLTIPFNRLHKLGERVGKKIGEITITRPILNAGRQTIMIEKEQNPYITKKELSIKLDISETAVDNNIAFLRNNGFIERI